MVEPTPGLNVPARERAYAAVYAYLDDHRGDPPTRDHMVGIVGGAVVAALDAYEGGTVPGEPT